jgi:hypothetical protein
MAQIGIGEIGAIEPGMGEVGTGEVSACEVRTGKDLPPFIMPICRSAGGCRRRRVDLSLLFAGRLLGPYEARSYAPAQIS